jgi:membrane protease YdiL (CAAX protease family)
MQEYTEAGQRKTPPYIPFLFYLIGGLLIFLLGSNTYELFPTNRNALYEWGLTLILLLLAVIMQRVSWLKIYQGIANVLFIASFANALNLSLGDFLGRLFHGMSSDAQIIAIDKLSQALPVIVAIILLSLWSGNDLGSLFLKKGDLRQGLRFGLISFGVFAAIFVVIVVFQASGPPSVGLFASGVSLHTVLVATPWILIFIFTNSLMEELWFRGVSLRKLTPMLGTALTILVTALVFGSMHLGVTYVTPIERFVFPVITFALGLVNAYMMLKTDSIWGSVLFHAGYDLFVILPVLTAM